MSNTIRISEIFGPTIQGEGALIGQPTIFVRTGGCDYRCEWCDTLHAVDTQYRNNWLMMSTEEIFAKVQELSNGVPMMVTLSGGNPAIQPLETLIALGKKQGYHFALETQGSIAKDWFAQLDVLTLSPKPPSSKMKTDWKALETCLEAARNVPTIVLKFVVLDEDDYLFAKTTAAQYPHLPVYLQPCNTMTQGEINQSIMTKNMQWLIAHTLADGWYTAKILPQLHVMLWGNTQGV